MKFTLSWLSDHLETSHDLATIAHTLTAIGLEVENIDDRAATLKPFVIAEVLSAEQHPNADKLRLCKVSDGKDVFQVVCGAPNARKGMKAVMAYGGTTIPRTGVVLTPSTIRGQESQAMLCSAFELQLGEDHDGIIELPADAPLGQSYAAWAGLNDATIEIKLTPNRGDCLGVRGIARDLAAAGLGKLKPLAPTPVVGNFKSPITWQLEPSATTACPIVAGRYFRGVKNRPSPDWLQQKLLSVGMQPISALVDITNYLSQDLARPLHVFSAKKLADKTLTMRLARNGEKIRALDNKEYALSDDMLVIANSNSVHSIAGIMGGLDSGVTMDDEDVFLEVAYFEPGAIAKTGRALGIMSDARYRFERGIDPLSISIGLDRATELILAICGGETSEKIIVDHYAPSHAAIDFNPDLIASHGGLTLDPTVARQKLIDLGFKVEQKTNSRWVVTPPSWRPDIAYPQCLVEEILRLVGFDNIPAVPLPRTLPTRVLDEQQRRLGLMRRALAARGLYETITWSFTEEKLARAMTSKPDQLLKIQNPIHSAFDIMRPSVLCNLLLVAKKNAARGMGRIDLFESGLAFHDVAPEQQRLTMAGLRHGAAETSWQPSAPRDTWLVKADLFAAIEATGFDPNHLRIEQTNLPPYYHPHRAARLSLGKETVGYCGELHPRLLLSLELDGPTLGFEIDLIAIPVPREQKSRARPPLMLQDLPQVRRDFAFTVAKDLPAATLIQAALKADKKIITAATVFDVYHQADKPDIKSIAIRLTLTPQEKTLSDQDIKSISDKVIAEVLKASGGQLRQ